MTKFKRVVFTSGHKKSGCIVTALHFTIVNVNAKHTHTQKYNKNNKFQKYTYKQKNK